MDVEVESRKRAQSERRRVALGAFADEPIGLIAGQLVVVEP
jgi:hypothetical protein